jgi:hypothetical protein
MIAVAGVLVAVLAQAPSTAPSLTRDEMAAFLQTARIVSSRQISKGITSPWRLTLSDGRVTHDAEFQSVDEHKTSQEFARGGRELNFVDSWRYNVAAFRLAELVGLGDMMPVTVERHWRGHDGALAWWIDTMMEEGERLKKKIEAPDSEMWNQQMYRLRVFSQLVDDTDRNVGNVLITRDWKVQMIDFTRAFRLAATIKPQEIPRCDRRLLDALDRLTLDQVVHATAKYLNPGEAKAVMARRDLIVGHVRRLVAEKGEASVLY